MGNVILDVSMSLDGFITGPNDDAANPLGLGGHRLVQWVFGDRTPDEDRLVEESEWRCGAVIVGRRTYDICSGPNGWGDGPFGLTPVFVVSHGAPDTVAEGGAPFTFVRDGIESALRQAKAVANGKDVQLMGANIARQYLKAGLVDEVRIHLAPVLLGDGVRLFERDRIAPVDLRRAHVIESPTATHLRFQVTGER